MTAIDWEAKPEPWRSIGLRFCRDLGLEAGRPKPVATDSGIRDRRKALGLTQAQLGAAAGYTLRSGRNAAMAAELSRSGAGASGRILDALERLEADSR